MKKRNWELFFREEAPRYLDNNFTKNTQFEAQFIKEELDLVKEEKILDIGCGTGRHSIELSKEGFQMTGIDLSEDQLQIARTKANELALDIKFIKGDASEILLNEKFDHAISLCEGAFSLFEEGIEPISFHLNILKNVNKMLKQSGKFILNALNGFRFIRECSDEDIQKGIFDPMTISKTEEVELKNAEKIQIREKGFLPNELKNMIECCGFEVLHIWGGSAWGWNREPLKLDEMEMMVISKKIREVE